MPTHPMQGLGTLSDRISGAELCAACDGSLAYKYMEGSLNSDAHLRRIGETELQRSTGGHVGRRRRGSKYWYTTS